jgi:uncharacterized protein
MSDIPRRLKQLEKLLASLDDDEAMLLSELDGFLAGILVCPDLIMPSEWLPMVWGRGNKDAAPVFENTNQAEQLVGLIMGRSNAVAAELQRGGGHYEPLFDIDTRHNEIFWEIWIDGFDTALQLRPEPWAKVRGGDEDALSAVAGFVALVQIGRGESTLPKEQIDEITAKAPDLIPTTSKLSMPGGSASKLAANSERRHQTSERSAITSHAHAVGKEIQAVLRPQLTMP